MTNTQKPSTTKFGYWYLVIGLFLAMFRALVSARTRTFSDQSVVHFLPEMHRIFRTPSAASALLVAAFFFTRSVAAEPFEPAISYPRTYGDFLYGLEELREYLERAECGGWQDTNATISGRKVDGSIPTPDVQGVPGRDNIDPLADPASGIGARGDFDYPDSAWGYMTSCDIYDTATINPEGWCLLYEKSTPKNCEKLFKRLTEELPQQVANGTFSTNDTRIACQTVTPVLGGPPLVRMHYCFMPPYTTAPFGGPPRNCEGQTCRTPDPPIFRCESPNPVAISRESSFYRHYDVTVSVPSNQTWYMKAECYEQYKEDDPKQKLTTRDDEQCELDLDQDQEPSWPDGDQGEQKGEVKPPEEDVKEPDPPERDVEFPWAEDPETNLTLVDYAAWAEEQGDSGFPPRLSDAIGGPVEAKVRASRSFSGSVHTDVFDDTAERAMASFWEEEQRELLRITRDPEVRVILPARFLHSLSDTDALFKNIREVPSKSVGLVEVTLKSGLDDLGLVFQSLMESQLFPLETVRIPVLLPLAGDIEARFADWEEWKAASEAIGSEHASRADEMMDVLWLYRDRIEDVRALGGAFHDYAIKFLEEDRAMREEMLQWYAENVEILNQATEQNESRRRVQRIWKRIQNALLVVEECQLLWCGNQRYSTPVYSLLDQWWWDEDWIPSLTSRDPSFAPRSISSIELSMPEDLVFDFSDFAFPSTRIVVPVLWPIQVKIKLPVPPSIGAEPDPIDFYPELPELPDPDIFESLPAPTVEMPDLPKITLPEGPTSGQYREVEDLLKELRGRIDGVFPPAGEYEYDTGILDTTFPPDMGRRDTMQGALCRFARSLRLPREEDREEGDPEAIIHVENDLHERVSRLFSRWLPNRTEDFAGRVVRLEEEEAPASTCEYDLLCLLFPKQRQTKASFQWFDAFQSVDHIKTLRDTVRDLTLPESADKNPYFHTRMPILRRLFPDLPILDRIRLIPENSDE